MVVLEARVGAVFIGVDRGRLEARSFMKISKVRASLPLTTRALTLLVARSLAPATMADVLVAYLQVAIPVGAPAQAKGHGSHPVLHFQLVPVGRYRVRGERRTSPSGNVRIAEDHQSIQQRAKIHVSVQAREHGVSDVADQVHDASRWECIQQPLITKPTVPLKDLAMGVMMGARDEDTVSTLAGRLARLDRELDPICGKGTGSTFKAINKAFVEELKFALPPLGEQIRIVAKIDELFSELDKGVESLKTARAQLKVYRQVVLKHAFEGKLTAKWRKIHSATPWTQTKLGSQLSFLTSGSRGWAKFYSAHGEKFIRAQNLKCDRLDLTDIAFVNLPSKSEGMRTCVPNGRFAYHYHWCKRHKNRIC